jgi:UDP-N-acetylmuramoylalanine--D-glutamate ligase
MKVGILGCGKTGLSAIKYFSDLNYNLFLWDDKVMPTGYKRINTIEELDLLFVSPGIANNKKQKHPLIVEALKKGIKITSDIELLLAKEKNAIFVGITGTNGKSTTTSLLEHLLKALSNKKVIAGGNIGLPVLSLEAADIYLLELSSFQLDLLQDASKLTTGIFLNLTPDHLDCYVDLEDYRDSKAKILQATNKIISSDYPLLEELLPGAIIFSRQQELERGLSLIKNRLTINQIFGHDKEVLEIESNLPGQYNAENIMAALLAAMTLGFSLEELIPHLKTFKPLRHRCELVLERDSCLFINDSKATNSDSTAAALDGLVGKKIILIAGGAIKDDGFKELKPFFPLFHEVLLVGEAAPVFHQILEEAGVKSRIVGTIERALDSLGDTWKKVDAVLLSPAAASKDQWNNFEERGDFFCKKVLELFSK